MEDLYSSLPAGLSDKTLRYELEDILSPIVNAIIASVAHEHKEPNGLPT